MVLLTKYPRTMVVLLVTWFAIWKRKEGIYLHGQVDSGKMMFSSSMFEATPWQMLGCMKIVVGEEV